MAKKNTAATALLLKITQGTCPRLQITPVKRVLPGSEDAETYPDARFISPKEVPTALGTLWSDNGDLVFQAYVPEHTGPADSYHRKFWGFTLGYSNPHWVDLRTAKAMVSALDKIGRAVEKLAERFGHAEDFAAQLMRFADALGVTTVYVARGVQFAADTPEWTVEDFREVTVQQAAGMIHSIEDRARVKGAEKEEVTQ